MFDRKIARVRRHERIRRIVSGTPQRPRAAVFRSARHIYIQVIDDTTGRTLVAASSREKPLLELAAAKKRKSEVALEVGKNLARRCAEKGIAEVAFDRGGFRYHGRVAALAKGAREAGLKF